MLKRLMISSLVLSGIALTGCQTKSDSGAATVTPAAAADSATSSGQSAVSSAESSVVDAAKAKLDKVADLIGQKKIDEADTLLQEVEKIKDSLPASMQTTVASLRTQIDSLKAASTNVPSIPSMQH